MIARYHASFVVKSDDQYLASDATEDVWTDSQSKALRFLVREWAEDCADAWRSDRNARVVTITRSLFATALDRAVEQGLVLRSSDDEGRDVYTAVSRV